MSKAVPVAFRFVLDAVAPMAWKNGGGVTREIAVWPLGATMEDFAWRISVADITADGPFSAFPGIDRQIVLIDGAGVHLQAHDDTFCHKLDRIGVPFAFAGDTSVHGTLIDGPTRDFNVMTRRDRCHATVDDLRERFDVTVGENATLLYVVSGSWRDADGEPLSAGEGMLFPAGAARAVQSYIPDDLAALCLRVVLHGEPT